MVVHDRLANIHLTVSRPSNFQAAWLFCLLFFSSSSVGRAGSFCATNILLERLKVEGMVDVFFTIHSLRRKHPGIVATYVSVSSTHAAQ